MAWRGVVWCAPRLFRVDGLNHVSSRHTFNHLILFLSTNLSSNSLFFLAGLHHSLYLSFYFFCFKYFLCIFYTPTIPIHAVLFCLKPTTVAKPWNVFSDKPLHPWVPTPLASFRIYLSFNTRFQRCKRTMIICFLLFF